MIQAWTVLVMISMAQLSSFAADGVLEILPDDGAVSLQVLGDKDDAWIFESSTDLENWTQFTDFHSVYSDHAPVALADPEELSFYRARSIPRFYDPLHIRTIELTFEESNWLSILQANYTDASILVGDLTVDGFVFADVGIRYKGNTSYTRSGEKKSIAIESDYTDINLEVMGYDDFNFNNAFGDETILREALYFNSIKEYAITPNAGFIKILINGENWGLYSNAQQQYGPLIREWFKSNDGDRWKSPSGTGAGGGTTGGGGGGFATGDKALLYLGDDSADYEALYELKSQNSLDPWAHLIAASKHLDETDTAGANYREAMDTVLAVDRWLWFLAAENIFTDDDSYWHKGADYQIYYEPDSGQIHPIEHDGNEAFTVSLHDLDPMYYEDNANRPIISKFLANPELRQRYLAHFRTILSERFNPTYLNALIDLYRGVIVNEVALDPKITYTVEDFETDIIELKGHIQSRYDYLIAHAEVAQVGPTIWSVSQPVPPVPGDSANITSTVSQNGTDVVNAVYLYYRQGSSGAYTDVEMLDDGLHADGAAGDGVFGESIPGFLAGQKVRYYLEAISGNASATAVYNPHRAELDPYIYEVTTELAGSTSIVINEFMASNDSAFADPQGEFDDWIELRNLTNSVVDLSGLFLSDNAGNPRKWEFPAGTTIAASGYLIVWADEDGSATPGLHANFKLSASGEEILLVDTDLNLNAVLDFVVYDSAQTDVSIGRTDKNPEPFISMSPTPGFANE